MKKDTRLQTEIDDMSIRSNQDSEISFHLPLWPTFCFSACSTKGQSKWRPQIKISRHIRYPIIDNQTQQNHTPNYTKSIKLSRLAIFPKVSSTPNLRYHVQSHESQHETCIVQCTSKMKERSDHSNIIVNQCRHCNLNKKFKGIGGGSDTILWF